MLNYLKHLDKDNKFNHIITEAIRNTDLKALRQTMTELNELSLPFGSHWNTLDDHLEVHVLLCNPFIQVLSILSQEFSGISEFKNIN